MPGDTIELLLRGWGAYHRERQRPEVRRAERTDHMLARIHIVPERRKRVRQLVKRDGSDRRTIMGRAAGLGHAVAMAFVDPIPCKETRSSGYQPERPVPGEYQRVESTVRALEQSDLLRGLCLRATYCVEGDREAKADWVTMQFRQASHDAPRVTVNVLKNEAAFGKVWVEARLSWAPQA